MCCGRCANAGKGRRPWAWNKAGPFGARCARGKIQRREMYLTKGVLVGRHCRLSASSQESPYIATHVNRMEQRMSSVGYANAAGLSHPSAYRASGRAGVRNALPSRTLPETPPARNVIADGPAQPLAMSSASHYSASSASLKATPVSAMSSPQCVVAGSPRRCLDLSPKKHFGAPIANPMELRTFGRSAANAAKRCRLLGSRKANPSTAVTAARREHKM
jgi:hypothetical protein